MSIDNFDNLKADTVLLSTDFVATQKSGGPRLKATLADIGTHIIAAGDRLLTTEWTDGTDGTGVALLTFTDSYGNALTAPISGYLYFSEDAAGLAAAALDTGATAAKGQISPAISTSNYHFVTNATGELDLTLTSAADSYWIVFIQPSGTLLISDEMAITGP